MLANGSINPCSSSSFSGMTLFCVSLRLLGPRKFRIKCSSFLRNRHQVYVFVRLFHLASMNFAIHAVVLLGFPTDVFSKVSSFAFSLCMCTVAKFVVDGAVIVLNCHLESVTGRD